MDRSFSAIGVAVESDGYNYYPVAVWK